MEPFWTPDSWGGWPEVAIVLGDGNGQQGVECAGVEVGQEDRGGCKARRVVEARPLAETLSRN